MNEQKCPLTPALLEIVTAMMELGNDDTEALANHLCRTVGSVRTELKRIYLILDAHSRFEIAYIGMRDGWLTPPPSDGITSRKADHETVPILEQTFSVLPITINHQRALGPPIPGHFHPNGEK